MTVAYRLMTTKQGGTHAVLLIMVVNARITFVINLAVYSTGITFRKFGPHPCMV